MHLYAFGGLSGAFILTFFDLSCYISVNSISSIRAHALISTRPRISAQPTVHYIKQAPLSNKQPRSQGSLLPALRREPWERGFRISAFSPPHDFLK